MTCTHGRYEQIHPDDGGPFGVGVCLDCAEPVVVTCLRLALPLRSLDHLGPGQRAALSDLQDRVARTVDRPVPT